MSHVLTLNAGSSSLKFALYALAGAEPEMLSTGQVERIGDDARLEAKGGHARIERALQGTEGADHAGACTAILALIAEHYPQAQVAAVGHRVVHGGARFEAPTAIDDTVLAEIERLAPFAPLHQPHNLEGIRAAQTAFPGTLQVACFDTAFHRSQPWQADVFALPRAYYDRGVRRYGFHGLSYDYVAGALAEAMPELAAGRVIVAHLGNGASMCALKGGVAQGSTMGFSALDGLMMGTRTGQIDPGVLLYLIEHEGLDAKALSDLLYRRSGLLGLSGISNDMRALEASEAPEAEQAIGHFIYRIRRELGALAGVLGGLDALVFTAGIGENSAMVRARVCADQAWLGLILDEEANAKRLPGVRTISTPESRVRVLVVPTDEERVIARAAAGLLGADSSETPP
ncbi:MAG: acetate/propionate family kinase [Pseudomonadota bacterium]